MSTDDTTWWTEAGGWSRRRRVEIEAELRRHGIDPDSSPFEAPPIAGIPFGKDSEEARAIERMIEQAGRERAPSGREQ